MHSSSYSSGSFVDANSLMMSCPVTCSRQDVTMATAHDRCGQHVQQAARARTAPSSCPWHTQPLQQSQAAADAMPCTSMLARPLQQTAGADTSNCPHLEEHTTAPTHGKSGSCPRKASQQERCNSEQHIMPSSCPRKAPQPKQNRTQNLRTASIPLAHPLCRLCCWQPNRPEPLPEPVPQPRPPPDASPGLHLFAFVVHPVTFPGDCHCEVIHAELLAGLPTGQQSLQGHNTYWWDTRHRARQCCMAAPEPACASRNRDASPD